jgi:hypothetical protein
MLEVATASLKVARDGGGNRYVHSDLYEFFEQRRAKEQAERDARTLPAAPPAPDVHALLGDKIRELFGLTEIDGGMMARIEQEVVTSALREMKAELERVLSHSKTEHQRQIETLERRISKLTDSLGLTEAELQRVLQQKGVDPGVASIYKTVQGLSAGAVQSELKKALMSKIFEANVELRKAIDGGPGSKP